MRVLLDNCVDHRLGGLLVGHEVVHASKIGWARLKNGDLIRTAEAEGWPVMITVDKNLRYQQNLAGRHISVIILAPLFTDFRGIAPLAGKILATLDSLAASSFIVIEPDSD